MILYHGLNIISHAYLSRVCGDDPLAGLEIYQEARFVPRMRG